MRRRRYHFITDPSLSERARVLLGIFARFGALSQPTMVDMYVMEYWFDDVDVQEIMTALEELKDIGAVTVSHGPMPSLIIKIQPDPVAWIGGDE